MKTQSIRISNKFDPNADLVIFHGDCRELMKEIPKKFVTLIVTSPPYNLGKEYEKKVDIEEYLKWHKDIIVQCNKLVRDEGSVCWQIGNYVNNSEIYPLDTLLYPIFRDVGLKLRNRIIWFFRHGLHCSRRFSGRYETMLWFTKSDNYIFNLDTVRVPQLYPNKKYYKGVKKGQVSSNSKGKNPGDVWEDITLDVPYDAWDISNVHANMPEKTPHPAQYPEALIERIILATTNKGDWVFDPFLGSGTTAVVALKFGRRVIGAEIVKKYINFTFERINKLISQKELF